MTKTKIGSQLSTRVQREALALFVHRYTREHKPAWAAGPWKDGKPYPVQFASDADWLAHTSFYVTAGGELSKKHVYCESSPTWPDDPELHNEPREGDAVAAHPVAQESERLARSECSPFLPPDPEEKNEERADWAGAALETFMCETRTDEGDALSDLLADLGHWADRNGARLSSIDGSPCSLLSELRRAAFHYDEETGGKGKQFAFLGGEFGPGPSITWAGKEKGNG